MTKRQIFLATIALLLANFMGGLDATIVNTALPVITSQLNGMRYIGWVSSTFLLGTAVTTVLWGQVGAIIGNKRAFQSGLVLFIFSSMLGGLAPNMAVLIAARALMGIGAGGMVSIPFIVYADLYPNAVQRARAIGWVTVAYTLSTVAGPVIGGFLVDALSWHWVFFINAPLGLLSFLLLQVNFKEEKKRQVNRNFDYLGAGLLVIALTVLLLASDSLAASFPRAGILLGLGLVFAIIFYQVEKGKGDKALIPVVLLKDWRIQAQNLILFLLNGFSIGYSVYAPLWAQGLLGTNATLGGLTQIAASLLLMVGTRVTARLMEIRPHYKWIVVIGTASALFSAACIVLATQNAPYWWLIFSGAFEGFGIGLSAVPIQVSIQDGVKQELIGVSTTWGLLFRTMGETFMSAIFGAVLSLRNNSQLHGQITAALMNKLTNPQSAKSLPAALLPQMRTILYNSLHTIMLLCLGLTIAAFAINLLRKEPQKQPRK